MIIDEICRSRLIRDMTGLAGDSFHMAWGERMSISRCFFILSFVMAVFAGIHGIVEVIPYRLLEGIPFCKVMFLITWMARNTVEPFGFMDIRLRTPLTTSFLSIGDGMTGPTIFIRRSSDDLEMKILKIGHLFFRIVYGSPHRLLDFQIHPERVSPLPILLLLSVHT